MERNFLTQEEFEKIRDDYNAIQHALCQCNEINLYRYSNNNSHIVPMKSSITISSGVIDSNSISNEKIPANAISICDIDDSIVDAPQSNFFNITSNEMIYFLYITPHKMNYYINDKKINFTFLSTLLSNNVIEYIKQMCEQGCIMHYDLCGHLLYVSDDSTYQMKINKAIESYNQYLKTPIIVNPTTIETMYPDIINYLQELENVLDIK